MYYRNYMYMYNQIYVEDECIYACPFLTDCPLYRKKKEILYFNTLTKKIICY